MHLVKKGLLSKVRARSPVRSLNYSRRFCLLRRCHGSSPVLGSVGAFAFVFGGLASIFMYFVNVYRRLYVNNDIFDHCHLSGSHGSIVFVFACWPIARPAALPEGLMLCFNTAYDSIADRASIFIWWAIAMLLIARPVCTWRGQAARAPVAHLNS